MRPYLLAITLLLLAVSCRNKQDTATIVTPFGEITSSDSLATIAPQGNRFTLEEIQQAGEMILLTITGPDTYYEYHGKSVGTRFLLCERFAQQLGVGVRVEICKDSADVMQKINDGEGDLAMLPLPKDSTVFHGTLADTIRHWYKPGMMADARNQEKYMFSHKAVRRRIFSPMLDRKSGIISKYDQYFISYGADIHWDWRLIAAQCYQESCFDPRAKSWAGACGLMQIMPSTAAHLNLAMSDIYDPEKNIAAATRYLRQLDSQLSDIRSSSERTKFVLASYNGGIHHIRDAMALARKYGKNPQSWADVRLFVLGLMKPEMYNDPVVKNGYMRGSETADYVEKILQRYDGYRGVAHKSVSASSSSSSIMTPRKATKKHRFK